MVLCTPTQGSNLMIFLIILIKMGEDRGSGHGAVIHALEWQDLLAKGRHRAVGEEQLRALQGRGLDQRRRARKLCASQILRNNNMIHA